MLLYRVESKLSTIDEHSEMEEISMGPYSSMEKVYETVYESEVGMFHPDVLFSIIGDDFYSIKSNHPLPSDDIMMNLRSNYQFAFRSIEQLNAWFSVQELRTLDKCHFLIAMYECPSYKVVSDPYQCVFDSFYSEQVSCHLIEDFIDAHHQILR
ncbi:MAG: hypothetical protein [Caudoviricetes sp.]|nr:MAG: hypothetical protein [Caudoviricetes sp.]